MPDVVSYEFNISAVQADFPLEAKNIDLNQVCNQLAGQGGSLESQSIALFFICVLGFAVFAPQIIRQLSAELQDQDKNKVTKAWMVAVFEMGILSAGVLLSVFVLIKVVVLT